MKFFNVFDISASGIYAQKRRMEIISQNISNADTILTETGEPYRRKYAVLSARSNRSDFSHILDGYSSHIKGAGVKVAAVNADIDPFKLEYKPEHPLADQNGYVRMPNVDTAVEMLEMLSATRSYEANVTIFNNAKAMYNKALEIGGR